MLARFSVFVALWLPQSAAAVIQGHSPSPAERRLTAAVVELRIGKNEICTATHLGGGQLLTAIHCLLDDRLDIEVRTQCGNPVTTLAAGKIRRLAPEPSGYDSMIDRHHRTVLVPRPDLALLLAPAVADLPRARVTSSPPRDGNEALLAGFGFDAPGAEGAPGFALGKVKLDGSDTERRRTAFEKDYAQAAFGDSGGPLFVEDDGLALFGVVSATRAEESFYARLDAPSLLPWLAKELAVLPAPTAHRFGFRPQLPFAIPGFEKASEPKGEAIRAQLECLAILENKRGFSSGPPSH